MNEGSSVNAILSPWLAELRRLQMIASPSPVLLGASWMPLRSSNEESTIVVIGNTGAGKSTLLNAILGEIDVLPTNAMRACTAAIIEIEYNYGNPMEEDRYEAIIEFYTSNMIVGHLRVPAGPAPSYHNDLASYIRFE